MATTGTPAIPDCIPLRRGPTDLRALLDGATAALRHQAEAHEVSLNVAVADGVPPSLTVDAEKIGWALATLVGNALRHVRKGTRHRPGGSIRVDAEPGEANTVVIRVRDDGPGIPTETLPWLFTRRPGAAHAVGLALALARDVAEAHGGTLTVASSTDPEHHGTAVTLTLPAG